MTGTKLGSFDETPYDHEPDIARHLAQAFRTISAGERHLFQKTAHGVEDLSVTGNAGLDSVDQALEGLLESVGLEADISDEVSAY